MTKSNLNRRKFLAGLGLTTAASMLPFTPLLESEAQAAGGPKRLIIFNTPNGTNLENWRCAGGESDFTLSPILAPFEEIRDKLLVLDGLDNEAALLKSASKSHHGLGGLWTGAEIVVQEAANFQAPGYARGPSVDQIVASEIGQDTAYESLQIGVRIHQNDLLTNPFYKGENQPLPSEIDPRAVFDRLFSEFTGEPEVAKRRRATRRSVLDFSKRELSGLGAKLGTSDRTKLEQHLEGIRALEKRLDVATQCSAPAQPTEMDVIDNDNLEEITAIQLDLMVQAMACDLTRVVGFQWGREGTTGNAKWIPEYAGAPSPRGIHGLSHNSDPGSVAYITGLNRWFSEQLVALVNRLSAIPEGGGTMMDNTLIVWSSPTATGINHTSRNVPVVMLQGDNGYFKTGRYLRWGEYGNDRTQEGKTGISGWWNKEHGGQPMNRLLVSICHAMGLSDVDTVGMPEFGSGPLDRLTG